MNKALKIITIMIFTISITIASYIIIEKSEIFNHTITNLETKEGITIIPTMSDAINADSAWCGTFQLVWNDFKNQIIKKDIVFSPQEEMAENLNKEEFTEDMISEKNYFKICGLKDLNIKDEIQNGIKNKFDIESDIIDNVNWSVENLNNAQDDYRRRYFLYSMLYKEFNFYNTFDVLENGKFGKKYDNVKYFGIDENTDEEIGKQIYVLYYNSKKDFAILINTKENDTIILCKNPKGKNFNEIYENINKKAAKYKGNIEFSINDEFKAPKMYFEEIKKYEELINKEFETADSTYRIGKIEDAMQSIQFVLDEKGGKIKSESYIQGITELGIDFVTDTSTPRYFYLDDTFAIFLKEKNEDVPYFAARIDDITKFQ